mgnify:CR=1 FL=1
MEGKEEQGANAEEKQEDQETQNKGSDRALILTVAVLALIVLAIIFLPRFFEPEPKTLMELHQLNLEGKLSADEGYVYGGEHSFVKFDNLWYLLLTAPEIERFFNIPFHYGPKEVEDIRPQGVFNSSNLNAHDTFYMLIDPEDEYGGYIGASILEADGVFIQAFGKTVTDACTNNVSYSCHNRPILSCNATSAPVFYFASENRTNLLYLDNCAIISGQKEELFRATDRMLFDLLGIM